MHFHDQLPAAWFEGLVVEQPRVEYKKGRTIRKWIKPAGARNEPLDLSVYNLAIAYQLGLNRWAALDWQRLRAKLVPEHLTRDLFAPQETAHEEPQPEESEAVEAVVPAAAAPVVPVAAATPAAVVPRETAAKPAVHTYGPAVAPASLSSNPPPAIAAGRAQGGRRFMSRGIR